MRIVVQLQQDDGCHQQASATEDLVQVDPPNSDPNHQKRKNIKITHNFPYQTALTAFRDLPTTKDEYNNVLVVIKSQQKHLQYSPRP